MKKFFDEYPVSLLLAYIIFISVPAYFVLQITFSMLADGSDPVLVFFACSVMTGIACLIMIPFTPVFGAMIIAFEITGWLLKLSFRGIRYLIKHFACKSASAKTATVTVLKSAK